MTGFYLRDSSFANLSHVPGLHSKLVAPARLKQAQLRSLPQLYPLGFTVLPHELKVHVRIRARVGTIPRLEDHLVHDVCGQTAARSGRGILARNTTRVYGAQHVCMEHDTRV